MIYFDNAATTHYKPQCVIDAVHLALTKLNVSAHRGTSRASLALEEKLQETRMLATAVAGGKDATAVFSQNCTTALNLAILGTARRGGHVVASATEHNSVLRPLMQLKSKGIVDVSVIYPNEHGQVVPQSVVDALRPNTYLVTVNNVSNVTGTRQQIGAISHAVKQEKKDVLVLCDCAQSVGYVVLDMAKDGIDMMAFPTHKGLHGVQGCGVLVFSNRVHPLPVVFGGTGSQSNSLLQPKSLPDGLESGTLNTPAILGANAAIRWWATNHKSNASKLVQLQQSLLDKLSTLPQVRVYSQPNQSGIVAFNVKNWDSAVVADYLSTHHDAATRAGLHCAPLMHKYLKTLGRGVVRASLAVDNTLSQVDSFVNFVEDLCKKDCLQ